MVPRELIGAMCWLKPASEYNVFGQTRIFGRNIRFCFVCKPNILFECPNIYSKDTERTFSSSGLLLTKRILSMTGENINIQLFLRDNLDVGKIT